MAEQPFPSIRGYSLDEKIGEGGFGVVYRAWQPVVERNVVIKAILPSFANQPDFIRRFEVEAHLVARLEHPYIVPLYDYWREPAGAFLVMRWLRGGSLRDSLKSDGAWDPLTCARLLNQIAAALSVAHRNHVIHQDLKPANILLDEDGNGYLTDFGIAQDLGGGVNLAQVEGRDDVIHGSPAYMAPEQITRDPITARSDVYSLGIVLFEVLTGRNPFDGADMIEILHRQTSLPLPALQDFNQSLPDALNIVIWKATAKDPDTRYSDVMSMANDFQAMVGDHVVDMQAVTSSEQVVASKPQTALVSLDDVLMNPYKGLKPFEQGDAADFFGRGQLVKQLLARLQEDVAYSRFLAVIGPSGSGKSSAVKAGLLPALRRGDLPGWEQWFVLEMSPGDAPLGELKAALMRIAHSSEAQHSLSFDHVCELGPVLDSILPGDDTELVLFVDQFEEVFTQADEQERERFLSLLHSGVTERTSRLRLIITLRADFYDRPLQYPVFGDLLRQRTEVVLPLSEDELRNAIVGPANRTGLLLENGLVEAIIADVARQPGTLPLLQYVLTELFEHRNQRQLTLKAYRNSGGLFDALARRADRIYEALQDADRAAARQIMLRLVTPGDGIEDTRRRVRREELLGLHTDDGVVSRVLDAFGAYRLLAFDYEPVTRAPTVEVAHEALIRRWQRLREWLHDSRDDLRTQRQLAAAVAEWHRSGHDTSFLASGARLARFEQLLDSVALALSDDERSYIQASVRLRLRRSRLSRVVMVVLFMLTIASVALAVFALDQRERSDQARERADAEAQISRSRELAASSLVLAEDAELSLLLSLEALNTADTFEARNSLLTALQTNSRMASHFQGDVGAVRSLGLSVDGTLLAAAGRNGTVWWWDVASRELTAGPMAGHEHWVNGVAFDHDASLLASVSEDGQAILWDVGAKAAYTAPINVTEGALLTVTYVSDEVGFVAGDERGTLYRIDVTTGESRVLTEAAHTGAIYRVLYDIEAGVLVTASADGVINLWHVSSQMEVERIVELSGVHTNWVMDVALSPDASMLASGDADGRIIFWEIENARPMFAAQQAHRGVVRSLALSPDGMTLLSAGDDGLLLIWDTTNGQLVDGWSMPAESAVRSVTYSRDGHHIITGDTHARITLWHGQPQPVPGSRLAQIDEQVLAVAYSPNGEWVAFAGGLQTDFSVRVRPAGEAAEPQVLVGHSAPVTDLAYTPDGRWLVSSSLDATALIWDVTSGTPLATLELPDSVFAVEVIREGAESLLVATTDNTGQVVLWRQGQGDWQPWGNALQHTDRVTGIAASPDGSLLVSGDRGGSLYLWDVQSQVQLAGPLSAHDGGILALTFSPDGRWIASASRDESVIVWDVATRSPLRDPLVAHDNWVMDVAFSHDGSLLVSGSGDGTLIVWDVATWRQIGQPMRGHRDWVTSMATSPVAAEMVSVGRDGQLIRWQLGVGSWQVLACEMVNRSLTVDESARYLGTAASSVVCADGVVQE